MIYFDSKMICLLCLFFSPGTYEPTEEECDFPSDSEDEEDELSADVKDKVGQYTDVKDKVGQYTDVKNKR